MTALPLHVAPVRDLNDPILSLLLEAQGALSRCRTAPALEIHEQSVRLNALALRLGLSILDALSTKGVLLLDPSGTQVENRVERRTSPLVTAPAPMRPPPVVLAPVVQHASPPASLEALKQLQQKGLGSAKESPPVPIVTTAPTLEIAMPAPVTAADAAAALAECRRFVDELERWRGTPAKEQQAHLAWVTCRLRHLQDEVPGISEDLRRQIERLFPRLTRYCDSENPGFVYGLATTHRPQRSSWQDDALAAWRRLPRVSGPPQGLLERVDRLLQEDEASDDTLKQAVEAAWNAGDDVLRARLEELLVGFGERLKGTGKLKTLRARVKKREEEGNEAVAAEDAAQPLPEDWPWLKNTREARVLVFGGDRQSPIARLKEAFGFESVDHVTCLNMRKVQAGAERVASHDLVLLQIRFLSHKASDMIVEACQRSGTPFISLHNGGMSIANVRAGLEREYGG